MSISQPETLQAIQAAVTNLRDLKKRADEKKSAEPTQGDAKVSTGESVSGSPSSVVGRVNELAPENLTVSKSASNPFDSEQSEKQSLEALKVPPEVKDLLMGLSSLLGIDDFSEIISGTVSPEKTAQMCKTGLDIARAVASPLVGPLGDLLNEIDADIAQRDEEKFGKTESQNINDTNLTQTANVTKSNDEKDLKKLMNSISAEEGIAVSGGGCSANLG